MNFNKAFKLSEKYVIDNSPQILTAVGIVGTVTTAILTGKAYVKADRKINGNVDHMSRKEVLERTWKFYIPPLTTGTLTLCAIVGANRIGSRRTAAVAAAYSLSERAWTEYKDKVTEKIGAKKEQDVVDSVAQDRVDRTFRGREVVTVGTGDVLFFDSLTGRYFRSTVEEVRAAENEVNFLIIHNDYATLTEFYNRIGLAQTVYSEEVGWNQDRLVELNFSTTISDEKEPCIVLNYQCAPIRDYSRLV